MHQTELQMKLGEREYTFSALTFKDWERLQTACQFAPYHQLKEAGATVVELADILRLCCEKTVTMDRLEGFVMSPRGLVEMFYLSIRRKHPDTTRDEVADAINLRDTEGLRAIQDFIQKVSLPDADPNEKKG